MTGKCISLEDIVQGRMSPVTVNISGEEKTFNAFRYTNQIDVPAPVDMRSGKIYSIPLCAEEDMDKMRFFYFRGDFEKEKLSEIAQIVQDCYDMETGTFKDDESVEEKLRLYKICDYEIKDVMQGEKEDYNIVEKKAPSIPMNIEAVSDGKKIFIHYSVDYGQFVFSDIAKTVEDCYDKISGTFKDEENLEKNIQSFGKAFGIKRKHLVSAVHWGIDGRTLTPPPSIRYDFEKKYHADENGFIHIPKDDPVVKMIIDMILEGKQGFVDKNIVEKHEDLGNGENSAS
ncbi:MAG: hypothetical protein KAS90_00820 [Candidatus Aenigmarchaeota archaeon]|nr:hypothetical protein [Candidatus Aenigmarchaeota archaeon]